MNRRHFILLLAAVAAVLCASVGGALAYFTASTSASGSRSLSIKAPSTHIEEKVVSGTKHVSVVNDKDSQAVFVRVQAFCGKEYELEYSSESNNWKQQDNYWVYDQILEPGSATEELLIHIRELPSASEGGEHFNIVVTEETSQVYYTADGVPYAVWDQEGGQG